MIKIERSTATNPTIVRNGVRQPVTLQMTVTQAELDSLEAESGEILYTVDETEVKTVVFQPKQPTTASTTEPTPEAPAVAAAAPAKRIIQPARKTAKVAQA
jgi:hypothetical protein